ncbi:threonine aldolase family protein [Arsenicicoccus dermatophilus]|uniref:threonine aldolase family protein n=1 Tax=Arsenicicoccus dermatophilus TaxID=1076331 RepID=UPI001F4C56AE|nr:beta-eliminating lyase-related protein [Arsenicicoccus dermatophilus]MCH8611699.1 beta-eliminating lyase-related protein [Arsenicicoccus dermatophilus]
MTLDERVAAARAACTDALPRPRTTMAEELRALAALPEADSGDQDVYGDGGPVAELERRVAQLLGTDTAVFFLSGIMAQQAALRTWCDRTGSRRVALPDLSHLLVHEEDGPRLLHDLEVVHLTTGARTPTADDVRAVPGHVAAVLVEVPLRDGGYLVPDLDELRMLSAACRERSIALHLDGARLWEAAAGLGCEPSDLARTAHSTYVSFYKGLGGMAGAAVGCDEDAADELRLWRRRLGGTIFTAYPLALAALHGLDTLLPRMGELHAYAKDLAVALDERGLLTRPQDVRSLAFRAWVPGSPDEVRERAAAVMEETKVVVPDRWRAADVPGWSWTEITVTAHLATHPVAQAADLLARLLP